MYYSGKCSLLQNSTTTKMKEYIFIEKRKKLLPEPYAMHVHDDNSLCSRSMYVRIDAIAAPIECPII